jgi:hypothetical protein
MIARRGQVTKSGHDPRPEIDGAVGVRPTPARRQRLLAGGSAVISNTGDDRTNLSSDRLFPKMGECREVLGGGPAPPSKL